MQYLASLHRAKKSNQTKTDESDHSLNFDCPRPLPSNHSLWLFQHLPEHPLSNFVKTRRKSRLEVRLAFGSLPNFHYEHDGDQYCA